MIFIDYYFATAILRFYVSVITTDGKRSRFNLFTRTETPLVINDHLTSWVSYHMVSC